MQRKYWPGPAALLALASLGMAQTAVPAAPAITSIVRSGATATTVTTVAGVPTVSTGTVSDGNAYNAFTTFQVAPGSTVDLLIPSAATANNLINLVSGSAVQIYGTLNSLLGGGAIGGNVFFADPQGIVIGTGGVVNVGSLTLATPTGDFVNNFFSDTGGNTAALLAGTEPIAAGGLIEVLGEIHSVGPTTLAGDIVNVGGTITTGASQAAFQQLVNTAGLQLGQSISITGSQITIDGALNGGSSQAVLNAGSGDLSLAASQSDTEAAAIAAATVTLGNASLSGDNVSLGASAVSTSDDSVSSSLEQNLDDKSLPFEISGNAAWNTAASTAAVQIGGGGGLTSITAAGDFSATASATTTVKVATTAKVASFNYGATNATASTVLASNATVTVGEAATLASTIANTLALDPTTKSTSTPAAAVSYGNASSNSSTALAGELSAATIAATSDNENSFSTVANGTGANAGVGVAIGSYSSQANTTLSGSATASGAGAPGNPAFNFSATSNDNIDNAASNSAVSKPSNGTVSTLQNVYNSANGGVPMLSNLNTFLLSSPTGQTPKKASGSTALGLGAAVSWLTSSNQADAVVTGKGSSGGDLQVASSAGDHPQVSASGTAGGGTTATLGGALAYADFSNTAATTVSGQLAATLDLGLSSTATLPDPFNTDPFTSLPGDFEGLTIEAPQSITDGDAYGADWNAAQTLGSDLVSSSNPDGIGQFLKSNLGVNNLVTSYTNTAATQNTAGTAFGAAGSLNFLALTNQATTTAAAGANLSAAIGDVNAAAVANASLITVAGMAASLGQLKGKNPGASGDAALGGSYNGTSLTNGATAAVDDGAQVTARNGAVNVNGDTTETLINATEAGDNAQQFGVNGAFASVAIANTALGYIQSDAVVNAATSVNVTADNNLTDFTVGGALGYGGAAEVGATVGWNQFTDTTEAYIGDPGNARTAATGSVQAGNVNVNAQGTESLWNISLAAEAASGQTQNGTGTADTSEGGGTAGMGASGQTPSFGMGVSGNVAINDIADTTLAFINNAADVGATNAINLAASDTSWAVSAGLAVALANSTSTDNALAGAFARNNFSKDTEAFGENAQLAGPVVNGVITPAGGISLSAAESGQLLTISAGGGVGVGSGISLAGAVNNNLLSNTTSAGFGAGANVQSSGAVTVGATQADKVLSVAGALSLSGDVGLGGALDLSTYTNATDAYIADGALVNAGGNVSLTAATAENVMPVVASLSAGDDIGVSGTATADELDNDTEATVGAALVTAGGNLLLGADDSSQLLQIAGAMGASSSLAAGLTGAISNPGDPLWKRTVKADVASGAQVSVAGSAASPINYRQQSVAGLLLDATAEGGADTIVGGVGASGTAGIAASLALNYFDEDVEATTAAGATITAGQGLALMADDSTQIMDAAGELAGAGSVALGASADVQFLTGAVLAQLGGDIAVNGDIAVAATQGGDDWSVAGAASLAGSGSLAGSASFVSNTSAITADVAPGAVVSTPDSINVAAQETSGTTTADGSLSGASAVSVGASVSLLNQNITTAADIGSGAVVTALGNGPAVSALSMFDGNPGQEPFNGLSVTADADNTLTTIAVGGAVSSGVSVVGSLVLNDIKDATSAYVDGNAVINPLATQPGAAGQENVNILAQDSTTLTSGAGAFAVGVAEISAGLGAAINLEGADVDSGSPFAGTASADESGGSQSAGVSPSSGFSKNTSAYIANGAVVNAAGALSLTALSTENLDDLEGSAAIGVVGLAGTVEVDSFNPTTAAYIGTCSAPPCTGGAQVNAGSASLLAADSLTLDSVVGAATAAADSFGAAVLETTIGGTTSATVAGGSRLATVGSDEIQSTFHDNLDTATLAGDAGSFVANVPTTTITDNSTNAAGIGDGAQVSSTGGAVEIFADSSRTVAPLSASAVAGVLGAGATLLNVDFEGSNAATIADNAIVGAPLGLTLSADLSDFVPSTLPSNFTSVYGVDSSSIPTGVLGATLAAASGVGAQVTLTDDADDTAGIGNASVSSGDGIRVSADNSPNLTANSAAADAGLVGAGASVAGISLDGATSASVGGAINAGSGPLFVVSNLNEDLTSSATGIGVGLATGNGTVATISDNSTNAVTQSGNDVAGSGAALEALTTRNASASSGSASLGLGTIGLSFADLGLGGSTTATLDGSLALTGAGPGVTAYLEAENNDTASVNAVVNAAGVANGAGAIAGNGGNSDPSLVNPEIATTVASGASLSAPTVDVEADNSSSLTSSASGGLAGAVNVGYIDAEGAADPALTLSMDGALTGNDVSVSTSGSQTVASSATSSQSASLASGYSTNDGAFANPTATLNLAGTIAAAGQATVSNSESNTVNAAANANAGYFNLASSGATNGNAGINNGNTINFTGSLTLADAGGSTDISDSSVNNIAQNDAIGGTGYSVSVASAGQTQARSTLTDNTVVNLNGLINSAGSVIIGASGDESATSNAYDDTSGVSGLEFITSSGFTTQAGTVAVNVGGDANIESTGPGSSVDIAAAYTAVALYANATGIAAPGLNGNGNGDSYVNADFSPTVNIVNGAQITSAAITLAATVGDTAAEASSPLFTSASVATAGTSSITGSTEADTSNYTTVDPTVNLVAGATLSTDSLEIEALSPAEPNFEESPTVSGVSGVVWVIERVEEPISYVVDWLPWPLSDIVDTVEEFVNEAVEEGLQSTTSTNTYGTFAPTGTVNLNGTIRQLPNPSTDIALTINPDGQVQSDSSDLSVAAQNSNDIVLATNLAGYFNPISIDIDAAGGNVSGSPTFVEEDMPAAVSVTNNSNATLVLPAFSDNSLNNDNFKVTTEANTVNLKGTDDTADSGTAFSVFNNGSGDVLFDGEFDNAPGSLNVVNQGGNILDLAGNPIVVNQLSLAAPHGSIGTGTSIACSLCPLGTINNSVVPLGAFYDEPAVFAYSSSNSYGPTNSGGLLAASPVLVPTVSAVARGDIDLELDPSEPAPGFIATTTPTVDLVNLLSGGDINITLDPTFIYGSDAYGDSIYELAGNTTYNLAKGQLLAAGGSVNLEFDGDAGDLVTLNDDGLVASGFSGVAFALDANGNASSAITIGNQTYDTALNYAQLSNGVALTDLTTEPSGLISLQGLGAVTGSGAMDVLLTPTAVSLTNDDPALTLQINNMQIGGGQDMINVFGNTFQAVSPQGIVSTGAIPGTQVTLGSYQGQNEGQVFVNSLGAIVLPASSQISGTTVNITAAGNIDTSAGEIYGSDITIASTGGSLTLGLTQSSGAINASAAGNLITSGNSYADLLAFDGITLTAGQSMTLNTPVQGASEMLTAGGGITAYGGLDSGPATLVAGGSITLPSVTSGNLNLQAGGFISLGDITSGDAVISAASNIFSPAPVGGVPNVLAMGNVVMTAGGSIGLQNDQIGVASGNFQAAGGISLGTPTGTGNFVGGDTPLTATGNVSLSAGTYLSLDQLTAGGSVNLSAQDDVDALDVSAAGATLSSATGSIQFGSISATNIALTAAGNLVGSDSSGEVLQGSNISLASGGAIGSATNPLQVEATGAVSANAAGDIMLTAPAGDLPVGAMTTPADLVLSAPAGSISSAVSGVNLSAASLNLTAGVAIGSAAAPLQLVSAEPVNATAPQGVALQAALGDLVAGSIVSANGDIDLGSLNGSILGNIPSSDPYGVSLNAGGNVNLTAAASIGSAAYPLHVKATGAINATAGQVVSLMSPFGTLPIGLVTAGGDIDLSTNNGSILPAAPGLNLSGANLNFNSYGDIGYAYEPLQISTPGTVNAYALSGGIALNAVQGNLELGNIYGGLDLNFSAPGSILNANASSPIQGDDANLTAGIAIGTPTAPLQLEMEGNISASAPQGISLTTPVGNLYESDIVSNGTVNLSAPDGYVGYEYGPGISAAVINMTSGQSVGTADAPVEIVSGVVNASAPDSVAIRNYAGDIDVGNIVTQGDINLFADNIYGAAAGLNLSGANITLNAPSGNIGAAGHPLTGTASQAWNLNGEFGVFLDSPGTFDADAISSLFNVQLNVAGGSASITSLQANDANIALTQPGASLTVAGADITGMLRASADTMDLTGITDSSATTPLYLFLVGADNNVAQSIHAAVTASAPVVIQNYSSQTGSITDNGDWFEVQAATVGQNATFANNWQSLAVTNAETSPQHLIADFVGSSAKWLAPYLAVSGTDLLPNQVFQLPSVLTTYQQALVSLLSRLP